MLNMQNPYRPSWSHPQKCIDIALKTRYNAHEVIFYMTKNETLHIRVNDMVKASAEKTLDRLGLSISEAVNMLLHQITLVGGLPFEVRVPLAPESVTVRNKEELYEKLSVGMEQIKAGNVTDADVVMAQLREKYGF
jgi:addiction module RelB/DinJ family antitoxin